MTENGGQRYCVQLSIGPDLKWSGGNRVQSCFHSKTPNKSCGQAPIRTYKRQYFLIFKRIIGNKFQHFSNPQVPSHVFTLTFSLINAFLEWIIGGKQALAKSSLNYSPQSVRAWLLAVYDRFDDRWLDFARLRFYLRRFFHYGFFWG